MSELDNVILGLKKCTTDNCDAHCPFDSKDCDCKDNLMKAALEQIKKLQRTHIVSSGGGLAIGELHGGLVINRKR